MMAGDCQQINSKQLAHLMGISERAVRKRAASGKWTRIYRHRQGGAGHVYMVSGLPDDVRLKLAARPDALPISESEQAGYLRACELIDETELAEACQRKIKETGMALFNRLPKSKQAMAEARLEILQARDAFNRTARLSKKNGTRIFIREYQAGSIKLPQWVEKAIGSRKGGRISLSWATLWRWEKAYSESGLAGLAGRIGATRETMIADHQCKFIEAMLVKFPHATIPHIRNGLAARFDGQAIPSDSAIRRYVKAWKKQNESLFLYLSNPDAWKSSHTAAFGQADEQITRLNQMWEFDSTPSDVMLTDGRHAVIGVVDVYSRRAKLHVAPTSKSSAIAALTRRALLDWGVLETAKTDQGADYISRHMVRVFNFLDVEHRLCNPFSPEEKPHIERFFRTFAHDIVELLPGYIGHNISDRKAIEARRSFASRLMQKGGDPVQINMDAEQFQVFCNRWCAAVYEQNPHAGLSGKSPLDMVRQWTAPIRRIGDERALDILLLPAPAGDGTREVGKKGIQVENSFFIAPELGPHVGETVFVLIDQCDYGIIYVFLIEPDGSKTYLCKAVDPMRTGHDRSEIAAIAKAVQKQVMAEGRRALKKAANEAAVEAIGNEILSHRERQRANVREFPKRSQEYDTPALEQAAQAVDDIRRASMGPQPYPISAAEESAAGELIEMAQAKRDARPLPATAQEKYEQIMDDLRAGCDVADADLAWVKRYEIWLETGEEAARW